MSDMNKSLKPSTVEFECSYCGYTRIYNKDEFKVEVTKGNKFTWVKFYTTCPICGREVSSIKTM